MITKNRFAEPEKRIAVFFPGSFAGSGGMGRTAGLFCNVLLDANPRYLIVLGCNSNADAVSAFVSTENKSRLLIKNIHWFKFRDKFGRVWLRPHSFFEYDFQDCDVWIFFSTPIEGTITPLRPYAVFCADLLVRIVPEALEKAASETTEGAWLNYRDRLLSYRNANLVFATTPRTVEDVIGFAGAPRWRVEQAPYFASVPPLSIEVPIPALPFSKYFVWTTNDTPHKNHRRAFLALEKYYQQFPTESVPVVIVGNGTDSFDPGRGYTGHRYTDDVQKFISESDVLRGNVYFIGSLPRPEFEALIRSALFLWHNVIYDNGTACVLEAAEFGVPSLASDYPQMRFFDDLFGTNAHFFPPYDIDASVNALIAMTRSAVVNRFAPKLTTPSSDAFKHWIVEKIDELCGQHPGGDFDATPHPLEILAQRASTRIWSHSQPYLENFPWLDTPVVGLIVESKHADAGERALVLLKKLLREKYQNFKAVMALPDDVVMLTRARRFIIDNSMMFDILLVVDIGARADLILLMDGADIIIEVVDAEQTTCKSTSSHEATLAAGKSKASFVISAEGLVGAQEELQRGISQTLFSFQEALNLAPTRGGAQKVPPPVCRRLSPVDFGSIPTLPSRIRISDGPDDTLLIFGFHGWEGNFRWVEKMALMVVNVSGAVLLIDAECRNVFFKASAPQPELVVYVNDLLAGTIQLQMGRQQYQLLLPKELRFIGRAQVCLISNVVAPSEDTADRRMLSWAMFELAVLSPAQQVNGKSLSFLKRMMKFKFWNWK